MNDPTNNDIVSMLEEHEEAIASCYAAIGACLPEMKPLWDRLVMDEKAHAEVLRMLSMRLKSGKVLVNTRKFNVAAVQTSIDYVRRQTAKIASEGITALRALSIALSFEQSIIEKQFFHVFETDSAEMKSEFQALLEHSVEHRNMIEEQLECEKRKRKS